MLHDAALASDVLEKNLAITDRFIVPSHFQYPHQWFWDASFHALILLHYHMDRARQELRSMLEAQWSCGFIPHIQFNPDVKSEYRPNSDDWATGHPTSGITQPAVIAVALEAVYHASGDRAFLEECYPKVLAYHDWLNRIRDVNGDGLITLIHPWESGTDNSPLFDVVRDRMITKDYAHFSGPPRADTHNVDQAQRPQNQDYLMYWGLIRFFQGLHWDQAEMANQSPFLIADPLNNAIWIKANESLANLADELNKPEDAKTLRRWADQTRQAMDKFWDEADQFFYALDVRTEKPIRIKTIHGFMPLYAQAASDTQIQQLIARHYLNPEEFYTPYGIPSTAMNEALFDPFRYWRGPVWINIHWFLVQGLNSCGRADLAKELVEKSNKLVENAGYREYYHPLTGEGLGAKDFTWSILANVMDKLL